MRKRVGGVSSAAGRPVILDVLPAHLAPRLDVVPWWKRLARWLLRGSRLKRYALASGGLLVAAGGIFLVVLLSRPSVRLLPTNLANKIQHFTPFFYENSIPAGYTFDEKRVVYAGQVLMIPLEKADGPTIVLTEQFLPPNLSDNDLQQNGQATSAPTGKASVNNIEDRLVGTLIVRDRNTLILLNAPSSASQEDLKALLQGLKPLR